MENKLNQFSLRVSLFYALVAGGWILLSDRLVSVLIPDSEHITHFQTYKGLAFVGVTAAFLYAVLRHQMWRWEQEAAQRRRTEALLNDQKRVLEMIAEGAPLHDTLDALLRVIEAQSQDMLCSILLLDADGMHLRHGAAPSLPESYNRAIDGIAIGPRVGSCGTAAFRREAVVVEDIATDPLWEDYRALAAEHSLRACWSTPIFDVQQHVLGTFALYFRTPRGPSEYHWRLIEMVTHTAAIAIDKQYKDEILRENEERLRVISALISDYAYSQIVASDGSTCLEWISEAFTKVTGYTLIEIKTPERWINIIHPDDRGLIMDY